eukprot:170242-Chlamydomonas_euryale.AAC.17
MPTPMCARARRQPARSCSVTATAARPRARPRAPTRSARAIDPRRPGSGCQQRSRPHHGATDTFRPTLNLIARLKASPSPVLRFRACQERGRPRQTRERPVWLTAHRRGQAPRAKKKARCKRGGTWWRLHSPRPLLGRPACDRAMSSSDDDDLPEWIKSISPPQPTGRQRSRVVVLDDSDDDKPLVAAAKGAPQRTQAEAAAAPAAPAEAAPYDGSPEVEIDGERALTGQLAAPEPAGVLEPQAGRGTVASEHVPSERQRPCRSPSRNSCLAIHMHACVHASVWLPGCMHVYVHTCVRAARRTSRTHGAWGRATCMCKM